MVVVVKIPWPFRYTKITQRRKLTRRCFMSYVIVGYSSESYCHALTHSLLFAHVCVWHRCKNKQEIQNSVSFLYLSSFHFVVRLLWTGLHERDRQYDSWLCVKYTHTRTCSHCIPRCSSMCMCACVPVRACTCVLTYTCITGILLSLHLLWIAVCSYLPIIAPPPSRPLSGKVYPAPTHGWNLTRLSNI